MRSRVHRSFSQCLLGTTSKKLFTFWRWKVAVSSETPVYIYQFTRRHIPEDSNLYQHRCESLKYRSILFVWNKLMWETRCRYEYFAGVWILCVDVSEHPVPSPQVVWTRHVEMEQTGCSETSAHAIQKPGGGNHPKERIQHSDHEICLKSRICCS